MKKSSLPQWLEKAVLYNIYPQSFRDTNGDGIGDLRGVLEKIDYIQSLGVTAIWLNPIYPSPFQDAGYDVTDYYNVAPRYGTKKDLKDLVTACHRRGLKLLLDFVPGHTSNQHPWFQKSASSVRNEFTNRYIWSDTGFGDGDTFLIRGYSDRVGHYKPNFFWFQPALNYGYAKPSRSWQLPTSHPDAQATIREMEKIMRHWLDFGVDGFRVDMAGSLIKDDPDNKANKALWNRIRKWMDRDYPGKILISEWSWPSQAIDSGFHLDFMIHFNNEGYNSLFRFESGRNVIPSHGNSYFDKRGKGTIEIFLKHYREFLDETKGKGFISIPTGNHDLPRINFGRTEQELKVAYAFIFTLPGVPTLYYGDEIGMKNISSAPNKEGGYIRTQARTPMQWDRSKNAGFSTAAEKKLYLPLDPQSSRPTVADQEKNKKSLLHFVRTLLQLRQKHEALGAAGDFQELPRGKKAYPFAYLRKSKGEKILVVVNPSGSRQSLSLPRSVSLKQAQTLLSDGVNVGIKGGKGVCECGPVSYAIVQL